MKAMRKFVGGLIATGALVVAVPAQAGMAVIYYSDYVGGTQVGGAVQDDCGNTTYWGQGSSIVQYGYFNLPCGSGNGWYSFYGNVYSTPWGPGWPYFH